MFRANASIIARNKTSELNAGVKIISKSNYFVMLIHKILNGSKRTVFIYYYLINPLTIPVRLSS